MKKSLPNSRWNVEDELPLYTEEDSVVLGIQRNNPYEIENMRTAYAMLSNLHHNFIIGAEEPVVNTIYYRVLPTDSVELAILSADTNIIYFDYPLDYEIEQWGSCYHDPEVSDPRYTWLYAVVPADYPLPLLPNLEILQECYLPTEFNGENAVETYIPDWQNGYALLEYVAYRESGNEDMFDPEDVEKYENILSHSATWGEEGDLPCREERSLWTWSRDFICGVQPTGNFKVYNTFTNSYEGIKNANVLIHNFIKIYCGPLDANGNYNSSVRFRTHAWYHIRFHNLHTRTCIMGGSKFLLGPVHRHLGCHSREGYNCSLPFNDIAWRYATINNAIETYFSYCQEYSLLFPYFVNIYVSNGVEDWGGCTPLFHKRHSPIIYNPFLVPALVFLQVPDMVLFITPGDSYYRTPGVYELVFHEFSHASHFEKVGNNYWSNFVTHIITYSGYGDDDQGDFAGYCGIGEMWGNFAGNHLLYKYMGCSYPYIYLTPWGNLYDPMYSTLPPHPAFSPRSYWFHPGILAKIHEDSGCEITEIYNALNADVTSLETLKNSCENLGFEEYIIQNAYELYNYWIP